MCKGKGSGRKTSTCRDECWTISHKERKLFAAYLGTVQRTETGRARIIRDSIDKDFIIIDLVYKYVEYFECRGHKSSPNGILSSLFVTAIYLEFIK